MNRLLKKAIRDLFQDKRRAAFSLMAILIGTMAFGIVTFSHEIISRELVRVYDAINPASGSIIVDRIDERLIALTDAFEEIAAFEQKAYVELQVYTEKDKRKKLELFAAGDFSNLQINKITWEEGSFQPGPGEVLIERDAVKVSGAGIGDSLTISLPDERTRDVTITGIVADISLHPATAHDTVYLYMSYDTLADMGLAGNKIDFTVTGDPYNKERILTVSNDYIRLLKEHGYTVSDLSVSDTPGVSMHLEEYKSALFLLQIFSFVTLLFGCMIMSSLITSIVSAQTRQIGVLKGIGASTGRIVSAYLTAFFILISGVSAVSILSSVLLAGKVSSALMSLGNMRPADTSVRLYFYGIYIGLSLIVPMAIAYFPIRRGVSISVKDALNDYGISSGEHHLKLPEPTFLSRPILLSLRNALRKKGRFILNAAILSIAGAFFVSVITAMISIQTTLAKNLDSWMFDYHYYTNVRYDGDELELMIKAVPGVTAHENWGSSKGILVHDNGELVASYPILSPPDNSLMIEPELIEGRWLSSEDTDEIVVSHKFFISEPGYQVGDRIKLQTGSSVQEFVIAGSMKDFGQTSIYMNQTCFQKYVPGENQLSNVKLNLEMSGRRKQIFKKTEAVLKEQGVLILHSQTKPDLNAIAAGHYAVTLQTFLFVICMLILVSALGLAATMNLQTSERTKEIGIMKAMGASKKQITRIITSESILIAMISWCGSVLLGLPLGVSGVYVFGNIILETPLKFSVAALLAADLIWLMLTFAVGYYASRSCAKRAANLSIRDSLKVE